MHMRKGHHPMSFQNIKPFISRPTYWEDNIQPAIVTPAALTSPTGEFANGVHIRRGLGWLVLTEENAVQLATDILNTIEATHKENTK